MITNTTQLHTKNWQHKRNTIGEIATDINDIKQCIDTICSTDKGSIPFMPEFGTEAMQALGENSDDAIDMISALWKTEIPKQEPRCEVTEITGVKEDNGRIKMKIYFREKSTKITQTTEVYI